MAYSDFNQAREDAQVINLVNRHRFEIQQQENRRKKEDAEMERSEALLQALLEVAAAFGIGGVELVALIGGEVSPWLAVPLVILAFCYSGIRLDRYFARVEK